MGALENVTCWRNSVTQEMNENRELKYKANVVKGLVNLYQFKYKDYYWQKLWLYNYDDIFFDYVTMVA